MSAASPHRESAAMTETLELPPPGQATYADLEALPERYVGELIDGTLYAQARPASPHAQAASALGMLLGSAFGRRYGNNGDGAQPGGWCLLVEPELHFGADVLVPDIAGWRRERMPQVPNAPWFELAPDWLCEVASPSTRRLDRSLKLERYHRVGVGHVWLVEPEGRFIEVYRRAEEGWLLAGNHFGDEVAGIEPFEAVPLMLAELWL
jgi:Uma2 family endonuclease